MIFRKAALKWCILWIALYRPKCIWLDFKLISLSLNCIAFKVKLQFCRLFVQRLGSELLFVSVMHVPKNKPQVVIVVLFRRDGSGSAAEMCWVWCVQLLWASRCLTSHRCLRWTHALVCQSSAELGRCFCGDVVMYSSIKRDMCCVPIHILSVLNSIRK